MSTQDSLVPELSDELRAQVEAWIVDDPDEATKNELGFEGQSLRSIRDIVRREMHAV